MASELKGIHRKIQALEKKRDRISSQRNTAKIKINLASQGVLRAQLKREKAFLELTRIDAIQDRIGRELREANTRLNGLLANGKKAPRMDKARREALIAEAGKCELCGSKENLTVHHVVPRVLGGSNERYNIRVLCESCHKQCHANGF